MDLSSSSLEAGQITTERGVVWKPDQTTPFRIIGEESHTILNVFFEQQIKNTIYEFGINHCVTGLILDPTI